MNCAEFQKVLPYIIETGGKAEEESHLQTCKVCSDLVSDLRYIAEQAKLLVPMMDPDPRVWNGIQDSLEREGLIKQKTTRARGRLLDPKSWGAVPWIGVAAAIALVVGASLLYHGASSQSGQAATPQSTTVAAPSNDDDQKLLSAINEKRPDLRPTYEKNLRRVNASIEDARKNVQSNPSDDDARQDLMRAQQQKSMMYDMAMKSLQ